MICTHTRTCTYTNTHSQTQLPGQQPSSITVLIHFATSINSAQVIVAGNKGGHVTWFISQPPQKNYSVLYCDQTSHGSHPIVALQVRLVCIWYGEIIFKREREGGREGGRERERVRGREGLTLFTTFPFRFLVDF